jgi:alkanesulfonate monooxygenase SsuD/methylene tetrahydromethanopterin reductase-like flavin-dependent oxidoreductase (luciferase family)
MAYDPSKIHRIEYDGKYHKFSGVSQTHPSPQRTPVIFQAGASKSGIAFGGKHAEAIFCGHSTTEKCKKYTSSVREAARAAGRDPKAINFFLGVMPFIGRTVEEAQARFDAAAARASVEGGLARMSSFINVDLSKYPQDQPFEFKGELKENSIHGAIETLAVATGDNVSTPADIGRWTGLGGSGPRFIGTPSMIADLMEKWVDEADIDGFNLLSK